MISNFQVFDPSPWFIKYLPVVEDAAMSIHFEDAGYEYSDSILGMGTIIIMVALIIIILLVLCPLSILYCCTKFRNFFKKQLGAIIFGRIIVFMDTSMLVITTCSWINLYQVHSGAMEISLSYYVSIGSLVLIAISSAGIFTYLLNFYLIRGAWKES